MANMIWPEGLAIIYPYGPIPLWEAAGAVGLLIVLSVAAIRLRRTHPYVLAGWLWYLCSLLPVIGLAQVGYQARADRYTYIPFVGLFVIAAWSIPALLLKQRAATRVALAVVALAVIVASSLATRIELGYYRDSVTLWSRAVAVTKDNWVAYDNLGIAFGKKGMFDEAERRLRIAVSLQSQNASVHADLGSALGFQGKTEEAVAHFSRSLELNPGSVRVRHNLAVALTTLGRHAAAIDVLKEALRISPTDATANFDMGQLLRARGNVKDAAVHLEAALKTQPNFPEARRALDELRRRGR
jgi:Flp pilus assembly protein TadD